MSYEWDFRPPLANMDALLWGALNSVGLAILAMIIAVVAGSLVAAMRMSKSVILRFPARVYTDFFRSSPLLVLIMWFYFALPLIVDVAIDPFRAALFAIGLQAAAYFAEFARGAVRSIPVGQWEGAAALGLRLYPTLRFIIVPAIVRMMLPVTLNLFVVVIKGTALAAAISYSELSYQAAVISSNSYRPLETFTVAAMIYFVIIFTFSWLAGVLEERLGREPA